MNISAKYFPLILLVLIFFDAKSAFSQSEDSLLQKINSMDVALNTPPDSEENLYLNTVSFQSFYDLLSPIGEWIQVSKEDIDEEMGDGNGQGNGLIADGENLAFIWKPTVTDAGWKPYTNGKWIYTAQGWVWASNDHWGWAVYHYGRWWNSKKFGWVWMPGYVWAPAWVMWRVADNHVGWTPLSPRAKWRVTTGITEANYKYKYNDADWVFVDKSKFADEINKGNIVASEKNGGLIAGSKTILDIKSENDAIVHSGPDAGEIEKATGNPVRERALKFVNDRSKVQIGENDISLYREPLMKYKSMEDRDKEHPKIFKRTERVKKIIKRRIRHRIRIRRRR
jgi:hypothetical protein